jgi:hypothetical protein
LIDNVIDILFGFDRKKQRSRELGFFGRVQAYAGSTETQGTGNLHFHCVLWIHGVPPTFAQIDAILANEVRATNFKQKLFSYTAGVVSHSLPVSPDIDCIS